MEAADVRAAMEAEMKHLYGDPLPTPADFAKGPVHGNTQGQTVNTDATAFANVSAFAQGTLRRLGESGEPMDDLLLDSLLDRPDGDILCIVQAAKENEGTLYDRLSKAYHEITGTDGDPDAEIGLQ